MWKGKFRILRILRNLWLICGILAGSFLILNSLGHSYPPNRVVGFFRLIERGGEIRIGSPAADDRQAGTFRIMRWFERSELVRTWKIEQTGQALSYDPDPANTDALTRAELIELIKNSLEEYRNGQLDTNSTAEDQIQILVLSEAVHSVRLDQFWDTGAAVTYYVSYQTLMEDILIILFWIGFVCSIFALIFDPEIQQRNTKSGCNSCGYTLNGLPTTTTYCPECGHAITTKKPRSKRGSRRHGMSA